MTKEITVNFQEWRPRAHSDISFHKVKAFARKSPDCALTDTGLHALYKKLCELRSVYDVRRCIAASDDLPPALPEHLNTLIRAIARIAQFASAVEAAEAAAAEQGTLETKRQGASAHLEALVRVARQVAHPVELVGTTERDVEGLFRRFLDAGSRLNVWIGRSQGALVLSEYGHAGWDRAVSPEQWLFGEALPDLYEELFGKNFTINTGALQKPHGRPMAFVRVCLRVMECYQADGSEWKPETISSYRKRAIAARRVQRRGK